MRWCKAAVLCGAVRCNAVVRSAQHSSALPLLACCRQLRPRASTGVRQAPRVQQHAFQRRVFARLGFRFGFAALSPSPRFESRLLQLDFIKKAGWGQASPGWGLTPNFGGVSPSAPRAVRCFLFRRLRWGTRAKIGVDCDAGVCTDSSHKQACW